VRLDAVRILDVVARRRDLVAGEDAERIVSASRERGLDAPHPRVDVRGIGRGELVVGLDVLDHQNGRAVFGSILTAAFRTGRGLPSAASLVTMPSRFRRAAPRAHAATLS